MAGLLSTPSVEEGLTTLLTCTLPYLQPNLQRLSRVLHGALRPRVAVQAVWGSRCPSRLIKLY